MDKEAPKQMAVKNKDWFLRKVIEKPLRIVSVIGILVGLTSLLANYAEQYPKAQEINSPTTSRITLEEIKSIGAIILSVSLYLISEQKENGDSKR